MNEIDIKLNDGKYRIIAEEGMRNFSAVRYGEKWRSLTGDKLILALCHKIQDLEEKNCDELELTSNQKFVNIRICDEGILNLKNARVAIMDYVTKYNKQYEALEIFVIDSIIEQFEKKIEEGE